MKSVITIILLAFSGISFADGFKTEKEAFAYTNAFMEKVLKSEFQKAFDTAKPYWPIPEVEVDGIVNTIKNQWPIVSQRFGNVVNTEFIKKENIGKSFLRYYYLLNFEKHAVYWRIDLYKPHDKWIINKIVFNDGLDDLYE